MTQEQGSFLGIRLKDTEIAELQGMSHADLLANAFNAFALELDTNGNTTRFLEIREEYSRKLIAFWAMKRNAYMAAIETELIENGEPLRIDDEQLTIQRIGEIGRDDDMSLFITRQTPLERDDVSVTINGRGEVDSFMRPPQIKSEIRTETEDTANLIYEIKFTGRFISTFDRLIVHEDPNYQRPYIKDKRTIDLSIFGIDLSAERAEIETP